VGYWQIHPETTETTRDVYALLRPCSQRLRSRLVRGLNNRLNDLVNDEDLELVLAVQRGLHTDGYRCGPLNIRESAVGWFADRIRADLAANDEERA
jgi:Rieske 2Fe-2S family protein